MTERLDAFIARAREKGMNHGTVRQVLLSVGWKDKEKRSARELELPIPKPRSDKMVHGPTKGRSSAPEKREMLSSFVDLCGVIRLHVQCDLVALYFTYLDFAFPAPARRTNYNQLQMILSIMRCS